MGDLRATFRRVRFGLGWVWGCYSHPKPIRWFYPPLPRWLGWIPAETQCRRGLYAHLRIDHPEALED